MRITSLVLLIVSLVSCAENKAQKFPSKEKLNGNVKLITTLTIYGWQNDTSKIITTYNRNGNDSLVSIYSLSHVLQYINTYDNHDCLIKAIFLHNGKFTDSTINKYNNQGDRIEQDKYSPSGKLELLRKYSYKHNFKGELTEQDEYNAIGKLSKKITYQYENNGCKKETNVFEGDQTQSYKMTETYDSSGKIISSIIQDIKNNKAELTAYKYENYDKNCNWLKKEEFVNGKLYRTEIRKIEYY